MSTLTEDQQRAFGDRITELYQDPQTAKYLSEKNSGLDPSKRLATLTAKKTAAASAEQNQTQAKAAFATATKTSVSSTEDYYKEASAAAAALVGELTEQHPLSHAIRKIRGGMVHESARGSKDTAPKS